MAKLAGIIFILASVASAYFAFQLRPSSSPAPANFLAAENGYGVTIDLTRYDKAALADTLAAMRQSGLVWLRQPISWADIEPAPGQFEWQKLDRIFAAIAQSNRHFTGANSEAAGRRAKPFQLIAVLESTPAWARAAATTPTTPPTELSNFGDFVRALAERYGQQLDYYQIWHQPNLSAYWGDTFVDAAAYAGMLREAALNIHAVDSEAYLLTAALGATTEDNPLNLNESAYLDQLYQVKADQWFDIVAVQPYGFWAPPLDAPDPIQLNFRRAELVRQVMLDHGDVKTPMWATAFGWVALPAGWAGQPSPWSHDLASVQTPRTALAIDHARRHWPWLGPMLAARWDVTDLAADDPARGLALLEHPSILEAIQAAAADDLVATPGYYPANHASGVYSPGWRQALNQADIPRQVPRTLAITFEGTRLDLLLNRGDFWGYLWVTIDGQAANELPQDSDGRSYVILYDPLDEQTQVTLARYLPYGRHEASIKAEGGWEQWVLQGWLVTNEVDRRLVWLGLATAGLLAGVSGLGLLWQFARLVVQIPKLMWAWAEILIALYGMFGERGQIIITFGLAVALYLSRGLFALALFPLLALAILLRPDLGLALITLALFFFRIPVQLPVGAFSPVELTLALTLAGFTFRSLVAAGRTAYSSPGDAIQSCDRRPTDWAALALVVLALLATLTAANFDVSLREWRVVILEPVIFYFLARLGADYGPTRASSFFPGRWVWRLIDTFMAGAALQALLALYLYFFTDRSIDTEGVHRALGLGYGSPNNLALVLGRAWPMLLAITMLHKATNLRRWLYGIGLFIVSLALYLTFSKGALLLGLPAGLLVMAWLYGLQSRSWRWRRLLIVIGVGMIIFALALIPLTQTTRFSNIFDFGEGSTGFFRLKLWQASWAMLRDHWLLGVGPDNFLYQYRTRYILPEAWQEPNLNHPHNLVLDFGTRLGLGGIAVLIWLQLAFWHSAWRLFKAQPDPLILGMMGSMAIFLSHGLVDNSYFLVDLAFAFFLIVGIVQRLKEASTQVNID